MTFHIIINDKGEDGTVGFQWQETHPRAWLINYEYHLLPEIRIGMITFLIYDHEPYTSMPIRWSIIKKVMSSEGLLKS